MATRSSTTASRPRRWVVDGAPVDVARARTETYPQPGALPEVSPATLAEDLVRRDFTVNALAVPVDDPGALLDLHGGLDDLRAGLLRVMHDRSFADDPTRALRAARYAARLDLEPELGTLELLRAEPTSTRSPATGGDRAGQAGRGAQGAPRVRAVGRVGVDRARARRRRADRPGRGVAGCATVVGRAVRPAAMLAAVRGPGPAVHELATLEPASPSAAVAAARGHAGTELVLARALGGEWLDRYVGEWRAVVLEISGEDLIAAGVAEGPAVGHGLAAALRAKLDGEAPTRSDELRIALDAASS